MKNPRAFPSQTTEGEEGFNKGMTLLDYFAGQALQGLIAGHQNHVDGSGDNAMYAKQAYWFAEAMLEERKKHI